MIYYFWSNEISGSISFQMVRLIGFIVIVLAIIVAFMYFFGKGEDKARATAVVDETKEVVGAIGDFLKGQKDKYNKGDYDKMIDKVEDSVGKLKTTSAEEKDAVADALQQIQSELKRVDTLPLNAEDKLELKRVLQEVEAELKKQTGN